MIRTIALAVAVAALSTSAFAGGHYKNKLCKAKSLDGKPVTFVCKASQKCCYNALLNEKKCASKKGPLGVGKNMLCL